MKVKELIKHLKKSNQEAEVVFAGEDGFYQEVCGVSPVSEKERNWLYVGAGEEVVEIN